MNRTLTITLRRDWAEALREAGVQARDGLSGSGYRGETLNFETPGAFFGRLSSRCWELVRVLQQEAACGVRELARRVGRDVRRVHEDTAVLAEIGLIKKDDAGKMRCPYADIHVDMHLRQAA